ncbi:MAG: methyltransferase domain-containing protein [Sulfuritalea sp.]|jgi:SAM-dependent methyltransferase|nr:methyltransferase domain-containing protein [Sulfuritalea sp.]
MKPEAYEAWYDSPRGRWIGTVEYALLRSLLRPEPGSSLLDIGCGTGHFTRAFARDVRGHVLGLDPNRDWLDYARTHAAAGEQYVAGLAESLPFPDRSFDYTVSVTALCFVERQQQALRELVRVTRRRFALGLLNRHSLLYLQKGRGGGTGAYQGAHWHTPAEIRTLFAPLPVCNLRLRTAIVLPHGTALGRAVERYWPQSILLGGFLVVSGDLTERSETHAI